VEVATSSNGNYDIALKVGGDTLVFQMHTNVFEIETQKGEEVDKSFFGLIHIYNFLSDSIKFNRENDLGLLICRIMINKEGGFLLEADAEIMEVFTKISSTNLSNQVWDEIIASVIEFSLNFDLTLPEFDKVRLMSVDKIETLSKNQKTQTSKRVGF